MYKIVGADGKEYGPVSLDQLKQWVSDGRINAQTRLQGPDGLWKAATDLPELASLFPSHASPGGPPPISSAALGQPQQNGLATTSLVLGILSVVCLGFLTGIPALICGHIARSRARREPARYGGAGMALAGLIMGYVSVVVTLLITCLIVSGMLLPALAKAKERAQEINCRNNMQAIGTGIRMWSTDNGNKYPFNVSTNQGGTLELCSRGADGFDRNSVAHFLVLSNELGTPKVLFCPADSSKSPAADWANLQAANVSYQLHSGEGVDGSHPQEVLAICPIHGNVLLCDGSVQSKVRKPGSGRVSPGQ